MADGSININTQALRSTAQEISRQSSVIDQVINDADGTVNRIIPGVWEGQAASTFQATFKKVAERIRRAKPVLTNYASYLNETAESYEAAERERQQDNASFDGGN